MELTTDPNFFIDNAPGMTLLPGILDTFTLSNGTTWSSGTSVTLVPQVTLDSINLNGDQIVYNLDPFGTEAIVFSAYQGAGNDPARWVTGGILDYASPITLTATVGSNVAVGSVMLRVVSNDPSDESIFFNGSSSFTFDYFSAPVGALIPYQFNLILLPNSMVGSATPIAETWDADTFSEQRYVEGEGFLNFVIPAPEPLHEGLLTGIVVLALLATWQVRAVAQMAGQSSSFSTTTTASRKLQRQGADSHH